MNKLLKLVKKRLKEQKGMTLIELLAVIVILGIISAIAIPSILGLMDNSKKDAHVANARQMINSAKMAVSGDASLQPKDKPVDLTLKNLEDKGYIEKIKDPDGGTSYDEDKSFVRISTDGTGFKYSVYLTNDTRGVGTQAEPVDEDKLNRESVTTNKPS